MNEREVDALLGKLGGAYQFAVIDDGVRATFRECLGDMKAADVNHAALRHMRSSPRFPTPAELRGRVEAEAPRPGPPSEVPIHERVSQAEVRAAVGTLLAAWQQRVTRERVPDEDDE